MNFYYTVIIEDDDDVLDPDLVAVTVHVRPRVLQPMLVNELIFRMQLNRFK